MPDIQAEVDRNRDLEIFKRMYTPAIGSGMVMDYLRQTGVDSLAGADMLAPVPGMYESSVEYGANPIAKALRDVARIHTAGLGARIFYTNHIGYDTHSHQPPVHPGTVARHDRSARRLPDRPARTWTRPRKSRCWSSPSSVGG